MLKVRLAYKIVLSGLSENSWGAGTFKRTVWHAMVLEYYSAGRFKRNKSDFLCTPKARPFDTGFPSRGREENPPKVNCKTCVKILEKHAHEFNNYFE